MVLKSRPDGRNACWLNSEEHTCLIQVLWVICAVLHNPIFLLGHSKPLSYLPWCLKYKKRPLVWSCIGNKLEERLELQPELTKTPTQAVCQVLCWAVMHHMVWYQSINMPTTGLSSPVDQWITVSVYHLFLPLWLSIWHNHSRSLWLWHAGKDRIVGRNSWYFKSFELLCSTNSTTETFQMLEALQHNIVFITWILILLHTHNYKCLFFYRDLRFFIHQCYTFLTNISDRTM